MPNLEVQNNPFTSILMVEAADPEAIGDADPAAGQMRLVAGADLSLYWLDSTGTATPIGGGSTVDDATISTTDITTNNASTSKHGWLKKLSNVSTEYMSGTGVWSTPAGGGSGGCLGAINYSTGVDTAWASRSSSTSADIDATNAAMTITVPASGKFLVSIQIMVRNTVTAGHMFLDVRTGSTVIGSQHIDGHLQGFAFATNYTSNQTALILCTGQTPGSLTIKAGFRISAGTMEVFANDGLNASGEALGPFVMAAWAA